VKAKTWDLEYQRHKIRAIRKIFLSSFKSSESIEIDGTIIENIQGSCFRSCSTIFATHNLHGIDRELEVRFAKKTSGSGIGCQFFIDGEHAGGDRSIQYPDPQQTNKQIDKGFIHYFLSVGLLRYGLPIAIGLAIVDLKSPLSLVIKRFIITLVVSSSGMSCYLWLHMKSMLKSRRRFNK
jgi:hypothetical protein